MSSTVYAAGAGDSAPKKCTATDVEYSVTNVVPHGACTVITDTISVDFDVLIWGNPQRYNLAVGYTNAGDNILQDVACLDTGIDIDGVGCSDYDGSGTVAAPLIASSTFNVSCDLDGNLLVDPLVNVDFYVSFDANAGGTTAEITSPKCSLQGGTSFPLAPAELILNKLVINDEGGSAAVSDFVLNADMGGGTVVLSGTDGIASSALPAGEYLLSESGPAGYMLDGISCTGAVYDAVTATLTIEPGDAATCVFTNNDEATTAPEEVDLSLLKSVNDTSPNIGDVVDFELLINNTGPDTATDISVVDVIPAGFQYVSGSIAGGDVSNESDPAGAGLQWTINSLAAGASSALTFQAEVLAP